MARDPREVDLSDPDNPEWTAEDFRRAKPVDELAPPLRDALYETFPKTRRRGPQRAPVKVRTTVRLSAPVREHFMRLAVEQGRPWQTLMDEKLLEVVAADKGA